MPLPTVARDLAADRLAAVDAAAPGLVEAFWVTGSAVSADGDWRPGRSDVDFIAATSRVPTEADLAALAEVHAERDGSYVDGVYLPVAALADPPVAQEPAPHVVDGTFDTGPCGQCTPVAWLELRQDGVALRGPAPTELVPAPDPAVLRAWLLGNLRGYWSVEADGGEQVLGARGPDGAARAYWVTWMVLGAARLHATLATGRVISKTAAGAYVAKLFPQHAGLVERCVRWRAGAPEEFTAAEGLEAVALVRAVVASAG